MKCIDGGHETRIAIKIDAVGGKIDNDMLIQKSLLTIY